MRMTLLLLLMLFLVPLNVSAAAEQALLKDRPDQINYSMGYHLGQQIQADGFAFEPELLWQALNEGQAGTGSQTIASENYKLGYALGREISQRQLEFRALALWQGLYDLVDQAEPRVREVEMVKLLEQLRGIPQTKVQIAETNPQPAPAKTSTAPPKVYRLPGQKFLAENMAGKGIISLPSGLQYRVIASGDGSQPRMSDSVIVNYLGKSIEGQIFSSNNSMPEEVAVNKVIPGWAQALTMMHEGDRWELYIPARLAFKDTGPMAGQTVIYDLELLEILPEFR